MYKVLIFLLAISSCSWVYGQTDSLTREEKRALDSMFKNDDFIKLMLGKKKSFFDINIGIGNGIFSLKNNALNAGVSVTNKTFYTPSAGYYHKSGLAVSVRGFLTADNSRLKMYQFAISPSYVYTNKNIDAGISYTRFIEGSSAGFEVSPFKNDLYGSVVYKKTWIEPGLALGYSSGKQVAYFDTAFWYTSPLYPYPARVIHISDTITTKLRAFSLIVSATHKWNYYKLINAKDAIQLQPVLFLNAGSLRWNTSHSSSLNNRRTFVQNYLKDRYGDGSESSSFKLQSAALLMQITYYIGPFYIQPQGYLDYYLPATTEKRLTALFSVTTGFSF